MEVLVMYTAILHPDEYDNLAVRSHVERRLRKCLDDCSGVHLYWTTSVEFDSEFSPLTVMRCVARGVRPEN